MAKTPKLLKHIDGTNEKVGKFQYIELPIGKVKSHDLNKEFFQDSQSSANSNATPNETEGNSYQQLLASIKSIGGIHTPILLTKDYRILSGHRRWLACCELGFTKIPAMVLLREITPGLEKFILLDANIQGRVFKDTRLAQLRKKRLECYFEMIPGLEARLTSADSKISAKEISEKSGVSLSSAKKDLTVLKREAVRSENSKAYKNSGVNESTITIVAMALGKVTSAYGVSNAATKKKIVSLADKFHRDIHKQK